MNGEDVSPLDSSFTIRSGFCHEIINYSIKMTKRKWARTSPCRTPVDATKVSDRFPQTITALYECKAIALTTASGTPK